MNMSSSVTFLTWPKLVILVVALSAVYSAVRGCSPILGAKQEEMPYKSQNSDIIVTAKVIRMVPDTRIPNHHVFNATLEVKCIYKGEQLEKNIIVTEAGDVPGLCHSTNLTVDVSYILYLRRDGEQFKQTFTADPDDEQYIDEITAVCGLYLHYPKGHIAEDKSYVCTPISEDEEECYGGTTLQPVVEEEMSDKKTEEKLEEKAETKPELGSVPENDAKYNNVRSDPENSGQTLFICWSSIISLISAIFLL